MKQTKQLFVFLLFVLCGAFSAISQQKNTATITKINRNNSEQISDFFNASLAPFYHGVASGDPLKDAVIIWTRVTANTPEVSVTWKVATDSAMNSIVKQGVVQTNENKDYTVKVDVTNLNPNTTYYYQFEAFNLKSEIGKTRTSPTVNVDNVRFGVVSCSNYQNGYFEAYDKLADRTDIDAIIHLGDYIYEYESGGYGYSDEVGRGHLPKNETITLSDYRVRYSYYRLDPMLRKLHQQHPFILIWDDHEFSNDANKFGAENHDPATEGSWEVRKNNAYKAYFEWMPVRANSIEEYRLYRDFSYGGLVDLLMLDTRIEGRGENAGTSNKMSIASKKQIKSEIKGIIAESSLNTIADLKSAIKKIAPYFINTKNLSEEEFNYVVDKFASVAYSYKNEGKRNLASKENQTQLEVLLAKATKSKKTAQKATYKSILGEAQFSWLLNKLSSSSATWKVIGNQVMMMNYNGVPTNDAWDGFSEEREKLYQHISNNNIKNVVVLTGDIHSTFAGDLKYDGDCIGSEFVVPSVTSQNLDAFGGIASGIAEFYTRLLNRHIKEVDLDAHGYFVLDVKENRVQADWFYINDVTKTNSGEFYHKGYYVNKNGCGIVETNRQAIQSAKSNYGKQPLNFNNENKEEVQQSLIVMGVYPNPISEEGNVHYLIQNSTEVTVELFNVKGQLVNTLLLNKKQEAGIYNLNFNIDSLAAGNYFLHIKSGGNKTVKQIIVK